MHPIGIFLRPCLKERKSKLGFFFFEERIIVPVSGGVGGGGS